MDTDPQRERVISTATRLYAELGFDATTIDMITATSGVSLPELRWHFPNNTELYREVMRRAFEAEREVMLEAIRDFTPTREAFDHTLDAYLDFYASHPDLLNLWLHRRTGDAIDTADLDREYTQPYLMFLTQALADSVPDPAHLDYVLWTFPWAVSGFLGHGMVHTDGHRPGRDATTPVTGRELEAFRTYLHVLAHRLLSLPTGVPSELEAESWEVE